jgi:predicted 3-demethylubiquinone-9 3-methyltransferase (glyoxalase superfamily)
MQKITPFLWFDSKAEEAANFYVSVFKNSKIVSIMRYGEAGPGPKGSVMSATFQLDGRVKRWTHVHLLPGHIVLRELRVPGRSR